MAAIVRSENFGVGSWIERRARMSPQSIAVIAGERSFTYAELAVRVRQVANALRSLGVGPGDRVAWLGANHPAFLESLFGAALIGAAIAPVNHRLPTEEVAGILEDIEPAVLILHEEPQPPVPGSVKDVVEVGGRTESGRAFERLVSDSPDAPPGEPIDLDDVCLLAHTSGTVGRPKGVMLTHRNVTWNAINIHSCADLRPTDVTIAIAPFFRVGGTGVNVLPLLFRGGAVVVAEQTGPDEILRHIQQHRVTVGFGNPDALDALVRSESWEGADLSTVRFILTGGVPVPERLITTYLDRGVPLLQGYGLSEAGPFVSLLDAEDALRKIGSAGKPAMFVDVRIADADGRDAAPGATAELLVRGPNVMAGYWRRPKETSEVLKPGGWLRTGDAARADDEGFIWIVDRVADAFTSHGGVVYPGDIERVLMSHPEVADAGLADIPANGDRVGVALIVPAAERAPDEEDLLALCRDRLATHQVPTLIRAVEQLPRSSVGKLVRTELRALASQRLATAAGASRANTES